MVPNGLSLIIGNAMKTQNKIISIPLYANSRDLIASQSLFSSAFYLVIPFLVLFMHDSLRLSGEVIGFVVGLRFFAQQMMYMKSEQLAHSIGGKNLLLLGCLTQASGFLCLAFANQPNLLIAGVLLTGVGGALFAPAKNLLMNEAGEGDHKLKSGKVLELGNSVAIAGEIGALVGPLLGFWLVSLGFHALAWAGALVFVAAMIWLAQKLPASFYYPALPKQKGTWQNVLQNRRFLVFVLAYSSYLLSYSQLFLALPLTLRHLGGESEYIGLLFAFSVLISMLLQKGLRSFTNRKESQLLVMGFSTLSLAFIYMAFVAIRHQTTGWHGYLPLLMFVFLINCGQILIVPTTKRLVSYFANGNDTTPYYQALALSGGFAVLVGSPIIGELMEATRHSLTLAGLPWFVMALFPALSAMVIGLMFPTTPARAY